MPINQNWGRWIYASIAKHFEDIIKPNFYFFLEGKERDTANIQDYCEFRMNGPSIKEELNNEFRIDVCINILLSTKRDLNDFFKHITNIGIIASAFTEGIKIYKFGNMSGDNPTDLFDCLVLNRLGDKTISIQQIGQVACEILIMQSSVEGCYRMFH